MDQFVVEAAIRNNIARFRALLQSPIEDAERHGLLKLLAKEHRKLMQIADDVPTKA